MFLMAFSYVARALHLLVQSLNNNNWPNKNNDVITDLGGEGNFPMFRLGPHLFPYFSTSPLPQHFPAFNTFPAVNTFPAFDSSRFHWLFL